MPEQLPPSETSESGILKTTYTPAEVKKYQEDQRLKRLRFKLEDRAPRLSNVLDSSQELLDKLPRAQQERESTTKALALTRAALLTVETATQLKTNTKKILPFLRIPQQIPSILDEATGQEYTAIRRLETLDIENFRYDLTHPMLAPTDDDYSVLRIEVPKAQVHDDCIIIVNYAPLMVTASREIHDAIYQKMLEAADDETQERLKGLVERTEARLLADLAANPQDSSTFNTTLNATLDYHLSALAEWQPAAREYSDLENWKGVGNRVSVFLQRDGQQYVNSQNYVLGTRLGLQIKATDLPEYRYGTRPDRVTAATHFFTRNIRDMSAELITQNCEVRILIPGSGDKQETRRRDPSKVLKALLQGST